MSTISKLEEQNKKLTNQKKGRTPSMRKLVHLVTKLTRIAQCKTHHKTKRMQFEV
jgi:hypothetical protein